MKNNRFKIINDLNEKVMVLDGSMGVLIQGYKLSEEDFRGEIKKDARVLLKGNNDLLSITKPEFIKNIYKDYLNAGSDIIETNTFNATTVSQKEYECSELVYEMNKRAAILANEAIFELGLDRDTKYIAGSIGPTAKTLSISPDPNNPAYREVSFDEMKMGYFEQICGLIDGGVDLLLIETIFDTLNARAALMAADEAYSQKNKTLPIMLSATIIDRSGRLLSGQTLEAFLYSMQNDNVISVGLNCSFGAKDLIPYIKEFSKITDLYISVHPNAGLPNKLGQYDETPEIMASYIEELVEGGYINIVGGCCGTKPAHIKAIKRATLEKKPRKIGGTPQQTVYCGLEPIFAKKENNFLNIGERNNVSGSRKFARLIREKKYEEALEIARSQVENGAMVIDVNFDDAMLDAKFEMANFMKLIASEPEISKVPIMIDSSKWEVLEAGLKAIQGKPIVNSISLKEGEDEFIRRAKIIKAFGAAVVVMAFDEIGQADTYERKIAVCKRAYDILTDKVGFNPYDIIFDPNVLAIGTGIHEHDNYAVDFIEATKWIKNNLPQAKVSGGISNLSFAFRGNNAIRETMHAVFLYHGINAGLDMGIVNPDSLRLYDEIEKDFLAIVEAIVLNKDNKSIQDLVEYNGNVGANTAKNNADKDLWRKENTKERLVHAIVKGITTYLNEDLHEAIKEYQSAVYIIENVLMEGMNRVGEIFGAGKMFLPQVIKSARVMKNAVEILEPFIEKDSENSSSYKKTKVLLATVKGDVHDIGKNITGLVLACNGFEITDIGIMVPAEEILLKAREINADIIGVSGLITPSLEEMAYLAESMAKENLNIPLLIGGAATSKVHTAVKIEPCYQGRVVYVTDASKSVEVCKNIENNKDAYLQAVAGDYEKIRTAYNKKEQQLVPLSEARNRAGKYNFADIIKPNFIGEKVFKDYSITDVRAYIDWTFLFAAYEMKKKYPGILDDAKYGEEAKKLYAEANELLDIVVRQKLITLNGVIGIYPANSDNEDIILYNNEKRDSELIRFCMLRSQADTDNGGCLSVADFIAPLKSNVIDYMGVFALTAGIGVNELADKFAKDKQADKAILVKLLADRLVEAFAEKMHGDVRKEIWGYEKNTNFSLDDLFKEKYVGIRPAIGYPAIPDHLEKAKLDKLLNLESSIGVKLTESYMMNPGASVCGLYLANSDAKYFDVGKVGDDQLVEYAKKKSTNVESIKKVISGQ